MSQSSQPHLAIPKKRGAVQQRHMGVYHNYGPPTPLQARSALPGCAGGERRCRPRGGPSVRDAGPAGAGAGDLRRRGPGSRGGFPRGGFPREGVPGAGTRGVPPPPPALPRPPRPSTGACPPPPLRAAPPHRQAVGGRGGTRDGRGSTAEVRRPGFDGRGFTQRFGPEVRSLRGRNAGCRCKKPGARKASWEAPRDPSHRTIEPSQRFLFFSPSNLPAEIFFSDPRR